MGRKKIKWRENGRKCDSKEGNEFFKKIRSNARDRTYKKVR